MSEHLPDIKLWVCGCGNNYNDVKSAAMCCCDGSAQLVEYTPHAKLKEAEDNYAHEISIAKCKHSDSIEYYKSLCKKHGIEEHQS